VVLLDGRHVKAALSAMTVKTDRTDARGPSVAYSSPATKRFFLYANLECFWDAD